MRDLQSLISDLASDDSAIRDEAALRLMDTREPAAVEPLLNAIDMPANVNHRGTLVYALGAFRCEPYVERLVDLALTGNFEVSTSALGIIDELEMTTDVALRLEMHLRRRASHAMLAEHQEVALEALSDILRRET